MRHDSPNSFPDIDGLRGRIPENTDSAPEAAGRRNHRFTSQSHTLMWLADTRTSMSRSVPHSSALVSAGAADRRVPAAAGVSPAAGASQVEKRLGGATQ